MVDLRVLVLAVGAAFFTPISAYNNGYGLKPFLGWQSWCAVGKCGKRTRTCGPSCPIFAAASVGCFWLLPLPDVPPPFCAPTNQVYLATTGIYSSNTLRPAFGTNA